jgi:hypothetical protein
VQGLVSGFFGIWTVFTITSPFPENGSPTQVDNPAKQCRLVFRSDPADVVLAMNSELLITELMLNTPTARRTIKPFFEKTSEGLLLKGYQSLFEPVGVGVKTESEVTIEYQDVDGIKLPHKLQIRGLLGREPIAAVLTFTEYVLNPRG